MIHPNKARWLGAATLSAILLLTGCTGSSDSGDSASEAATTGGVLKIVGTADVDHVDPTSAALVSTNNLLRATTRQLISYAASTDESERIVAQGDLATEVPTPTDDGLVYTFTIREGAQFDAPSGARQITSADIARGFEKLCNPSIPAASLGYFQTLIEGMDEYCEAFQEVSPEAAPMKEYMESHDISGIDSSDPTKLVITLTEPASDFIYMVSLPAVSPVAVESLDYVPDSPEWRENFISSGPYTISEHVADQSMTLVRNEAWKPESDPLRSANVDSIEITFGVSADAAMQQLQSGDADMTFDITIPSAILQQLTAVNDPNLFTLTSGQVNPFIWINTKTDNNNGALKDLKVRQALNYAVDKAAVVQQLGGPDVAAVNNGIFGPGVLGYEEFDPYPSTDSAGDPEKAKELLAEAGYPDGLTLKMPYRTQNAEPAIAQTIQASLAKAGITVELIPVTPADYYSKFMTNRENTASGAWDIAPVGWTPDWAGGSARSVFQPQFTFTGTAQTYNYVDYNNEQANALAAQALQETDPDKVADLWHQVDEAVMADAPIISVAAPKVILYHSTAVENFKPWALGVQGDWTNVSISR
ncbi:ABC transporter substrate-binding protein [Brooklawnia cerclae]|uniref:Peptide/nickel transport system substrate-binding protein n=1 Tax=Brooklawnia cerclae TaxID=349934 RepID=A0ABX0SL69_9ACTN|nr:ABC transporter substrate-binding protein [Brooklawnia cerclae]NIH58705.1 peptide/nickel transport system substrate-binding protein [Brooklawnia cerclae]NIH58829.1 peptide/nickel transport system substrate-binding protein [Brooklawnia cerclae]